MKNVMDSFRLEGRAALVTGGANGLGRVMAIGLAQAGAKIAICDIDEAGAARVAQEIADITGQQTMSLRLDVTDRDVANPVAQAVYDRFGKLDILLNNTGIWRNQPAEDMTWENWNDVINVCLNGTFLMSQAVGRLMIAQGGGSIINIASVSGEMINDMPFKCSYNVAKAGVIMLTKALAAEWARYDIRVNAISPSSMKYENLENTRDETLLQWFGMVPMGRWGYSEELCGALVYLASEASSFVTGAVLPVQGGDGIWKGLKPYVRPGKTIEIGCEQA